MSTIRVCECRHPFEIEDDTGTRCLKCSRPTASPVCECRCPARSPRALGRDWCASCLRWIDTPTAAEEAA